MGTLSAKSHLKMDFQLEFQHLTNIPVDIRVNFKKVWILGCVKLWKKTMSNAFFLYAILL